MKIHQELVIQDLKDTTLKLQDKLMELAKAKQEEIDIKEAEEKLKVGCKIEAEQQPYLKSIPAKKLYSDQKFLDAKEHHSKRVELLKKTLILEAENGALKYRHRTLLALIAAQAEIGDCE